MDYLDKGHTITGAFCADLLRQLRKKTNQIRRGKLTRGVLFHQDNAPAHTSTVVMAAIQKYGFQFVVDPPSSPDLASSDYYHFQKIKKQLADHHFARDDDRTNAVDHFLRDQNDAFYTEVIRLLHDRWTKCVNEGGDSVEKLLYLIRIHILNYFPLLYKLYIITFFFFFFFFFGWGV